MDERVCPNISPISGLNPGIIIPSVVEYCTLIRLTIMRKRVACSSDFFQKSLSWLGAGAIVSRILAVSLFVMRMRFASRTSYFTV